MEELKDFLEKKINSCKMLGSMEREAWAFKQVLREIRRQEQISNIVDNRMQFKCSKCGSNWGELRSICFECGHEEDISK